MDNGIEIDVSREIVAYIKELQNKVTEAVNDFQQKTNNQFIVSFENVYDVSSTLCGDWSVYRGCKVNLKIV